MERKERYVSVITHTVIQLRQKNVVVVVDLFESSIDTRHLASERIQEPVMRPFDVDHFHS